MSNNLSISQRLARRWPVLLILLLLGLAIFFTVRHILGADRRAFIEKLRVGYENDIVLLPVYAKLTDPQCYQALILKGIQPRGPATFDLVWRVLRAKQPAQADLLSLTETNWADAVAYDEWQEISLGAQAWQKAVLRLLRWPDRSLTATTRRLETWPPALLRFTRSRDYSNDFLETVIRALQRDAARVQKYLDVGAPQAAPAEKLQAACALYNAGACLHGLKESAKWRQSASAAILKYLELNQKPDGTLGDLSATLTAIETIMPPLAIAHRAGLPPPGGELADRLQRLLDFLVYALDMRGCVPFVAPDFAPDAENHDSLFINPTTDDVNQREWLFWGSRVFNRPDFAFVAYGGFDMLEAMPPPQTSKAFPDLGLYVFRNNWEISRYVRRGTLDNDLATPKAKGTTEQEIEFHHLSHTVWFDARQGLIELFVFGQRQCQLRLPGANFQVTTWEPGERKDLLRARAGSMELSVVYLKDLDGWIVRLAGLEPGSGVELDSLRASIARQADGRGLVTDPGRPFVSRQTFLKLRMKPFGALGIRGNGELEELTGGRWRIRRPAGGSDLVLTLAGAVGVWLKANAPPPLWPAQAVAAREFGVTNNACYFDVGGGLGVVPGDGGPEKREILRVTFDGADLSGD